jgi:hypothetical protein
MPILGVPASLGNRSSFVCWRRGCSCAFLNCSAMLGKAVRIRYCPATVSDARWILQTTAPRVGRFSVPGRKVRRPVAPRMYLCSSSEGKENDYEGI